jgi:hypothetical protein
MAIVVKTPAYQFDFGSFNINPLTITTTGSASYSTNIIKFGTGSAYFVDLSYINITGLTSSTFTSSWTVECWIYLTNQSDVNGFTQTIFSAQSTTNYGFYIDLNTDYTLQAYISTNGTS